MERRILRGDNLSGPLRSAGKIFPPMVADLVAVGETIGNVDSTLEISGDIHEKLLQTALKRMTTLIEPLMIVFMGGGVGFVVYAFVAGVLSAYGNATG